MTGFVDRENQIFETIQQLKDRELDFIVVGGYAVSAYQHRFSVDADLVIPGKQSNRFTEILESNGFEQIENRDLVYSRRYLAYQKDWELPVTIDLLVDELQCRQTDASWSYRYLEQHSLTRQIQGSEKAVEVQVPEKELLIAVKLHSGRLTDVRDVVALATDIETKKVENHLKRGKTEKLKKVLKQVLKTLNDENFGDAFKGVFRQSGIPGDNIKTIQELIQKQLD